MKGRAITTFARRSALAAGLSLALALALLAAACGGGGGADETPTPTVASDGASDGAVAATATVPVPTEATTGAPTEAPAPTPSPTEEEVPMPGELTVIVPEGYRELTGDTLEITLEPRGARELNPVRLTGDSFPDCATFLFAFAFQVIEPYRGPGRIQIFATRMGDRELLLGGTSGRYEVGCVELEVVNDSDIEVTVEFMYKALEAAS